MIPKTSSDRKESLSELPQLVDQLREQIEGEVRFDGASRAMYATDASHYRQIPIGVVIPKTNEDVIKTVQLCSKFQVPLLSRGGGTSVAGQCCNEAVVIDFSKYLNQVLEVDPDKKIARVQPGVVLDDLQKQLLPHGLAFGPDPSTHSRCTLGGMIGNDACGVHSLFSGRTVHNVISLKVLTPQGEILEVSKGENAVPSKEISKKLHQLTERYESLIQEKFPKIPRCVSGYGLGQLLDENQFNVAGALTGTEGTCVVVLEATVRLVQMPSNKQLVVIGYPSIFEAADAVSGLLAVKPIGLEAFDQSMMDNIEAKGFHHDRIEMLPSGKSWLLLELGRDDGKNERQIAQVQELVKDSESMKIITDPEEMKKIWSLREFGPGAAVFVPGKPNTWSGWEDSAVDPHQLGAYLRDLQSLFDQYGYEGAFYGHFGDGCVHVRISFDFSSQEGLQKYREFMNQAADLVLKYDGSLSGEHGDGQARGELLEKMYGSELVQAFREFKAIWDPQNIMNPGKVIDANPLDENLRIRTNPPKEKIETTFKFPEDQNDFYQAVSRCVGIGKCRQKESGIMCPSYKATLEEQHSTRGRARLLAEMLEGDVIQWGCNDSKIKESLDLCLSCKGCKTECPTNVDMATYKAEFLSHYYKKNKRSFRSSFFGHLNRWTALASKMPKLANFIGQNPKVSKWVKNRLGISPKRSLPVFSETSFRKWFYQRRVKQRKKPEVILWPDTFNNYFYPQALQSATYVLESVGFRVRLPRKKLCCGRPLYDQGMLKQAKSQLWQILRHSISDIRRGVPIVGLEPSCVSVFKDELKNLFPGDFLATRFSEQVFTLSDFLSKYASLPKPINRNGSVFIQGHCHQQTVLGMGTEEEVLQKLGFDCQMPDLGCCGMAGVFGFEDDHYDISMKIADQELLPTVKQLGQEMPIVANGFSCREQIKQGSGRQAFHIAEIIEEAIKS